MANPFDQFMQPNGLPDFSQFGGAPQPNPMRQPPAMGGAAPSGQNPLQQLLMLLPLLVAAKRGGGAGVGGFAQGYLSSRQYLDEQRRMAEAMQMRQEQEQYERQRQEQADRERRQKAASEILLGAGQPLLERTLSTLDQTPGLDPDTAASQQADAYAKVLQRIYPGLGLTGEDVRAVMPDVKTQYSARLQRHANEVLSSYEGKYAEKDLQALGPKIPFNGRAVTIDELRGIAGKATGLTPIKEQEKTKPVYRISPDKSKIEQVGEVPEGAQVVAEPQPPRVSVNVATPQDTDTLAQMLVDGRALPGTLSKRTASYNAILARANKLSLAQTGKPLNLNKLQLNYEGAKRFVGSMNGPQMVRFNALAGSVVNTIDEVRRLSDELKQGGVQLYNRARRNTVLQVYGNTPQSGLAAQYLGALNTLKEEFANLAQGGYAPTEDAWRLANQQINGDFGVKDLDASLTEVQRLINYRLQAFDELQPRTIGGGSPGVQESGGGAEVWVFGPDGKLHPKGKGK